MRAIVVTSLFVVLGFAGCIDDGLLEPDESTGSAQDSFQADPSHEEMPERSFEPELILDAPELIQLQVEQGTQVNFTFNITDLHDYPFPLTFVDWNLTYSREPNPVAEGDAHDLPAEWNRTLFAEAYHEFTFRVDDGQGFKANKSVIIKVGEPATDEVEVVKEIVGAVDVVETLYAPVDCELCVDSYLATGEPIGAAGCKGFNARINSHDCAWVPLSAASWGQPFTVTSIVATDGALNGAGDLGDPDVEFLTSCDPLNAETVSMDFVDTGFSAAPKEGIIPEDAGCMVAYEFGWPTAAGVFFTFEWKEAPDPYPGFYTKIQATHGCGVPLAVDCAPSNCDGFQDRINGLGCVWVPIPATAAGASFQVRDFVGTQPPAPWVVNDPDVKFLSDCSLEAEVIGSSAVGGSESGTIPDGAGCIFAFEWTSHPGVIDILIDPIE